MGLNLSAIHLNDWLYSIQESEGINIEILKKELKEKLGELPQDDSVTIDNEFPRVGSYTAYGIFRYCLIYLSFGDYKDELTEDDDYELIALQEFKKYLKPMSAPIKYVEHFTETDDSDTIFLPVLFDKPFVFYDRDVASLPASKKVLEVLAEIIGFDLFSEFDAEYQDDRWIPIATVKNVARIIYNFFDKYSNTCVIFS